MKKIAGLALVMLVSSHTVWAASGCIALGGVDGFSSLGDPAATEQLRRTGRLRLYVHDFIWSKMAPHERQVVSRPLGALGPAWAEVGEAPNATQFWASHIPTWKQAGLTVSQAHVNLVVDGSQPARFKSFVDTGRDVGVKIVAPIWSPNGGEWRKGPFQSPAFDTVKEMAKYGGGLTIDSPPWFFLKQPTKYQEFVEDEIKWARAAGIQSTLIISPPRSNSDSFMDPMRRMIAGLRAAHALPDDFIMENYMASPPPQFRFMIGSENDPESIAAAALWISQNVSGGSLGCN